MIWHGIIDSFTRYGAFGIGGLFFAEMLGAPIPAETTLTLLGIGIASHHLSWASVYVGAVMGHCAGSTVTYWLGAHYGHRAWRWLLSRFPSLKRQTDKHQRWLNRGQTTSVVVGKFLSIVRLLVPVAAGMNRMPWYQFSFLNTLTAAVWAAIYLSEGYWLEKTGQHLSARGVPLPWLITGGLLLFLGLFLGRLILRKATDVNRGDRNV